MTKEPNRASISVVIPTYNHDNWITKAIESVYAQNLQPLEVIVVNNGSTDNTANVIRRLATTLPDNFKYVDKRHGNEATSRNRGVSLARGDHIAFLDSDDTWLPDKLARQMALFESDPSIALTFTAYTRVSGSQRELVSLSTWSPEPEAALRRLMGGCCITPSTVIVRRDVLESVGPFDESIELGCDWEMWLRIAAAGHRMGYLKTPLMEYLWHTTNLSRDQKRISEAAQTIFPRLFESGNLPESIQALENQCYARWDMIHACHCLAAGDTQDARRYLLKAFRARPASLRPGWVLMYLRSLLMRPHQQTGS